MITRHFKTIRLASKLWYEEDADLLAATVAYYAIFALAPLLLLTVAILGLFFGSDVVIAELLRWGAVLGPDVLSLLTKAVQNLDTLSLGIGVPFFGAIFFSGMVIIVCNTFTTGLHKLWNIPHQGFLGWLKKCRNSIIFLVALQAYLLLVIAMSYVATSLEGILWAPALATIRTFLFLLVTTGLFSFMYRLLPWQAPNIKSRLYGAGIASVLFVLAKSVVALYIATTPVPGLYGVAGLLLVVLIWMYVTAAILYFGAALAAVKDSHFTT